MNLHEIVSSAISSINPFQEITIISRGGYMVNDFGEQVVCKDKETKVMADVQPVSAEDIQFINNYNQSSVYKSFYVSEDVHGVNRQLAKAGDLIIWNGNTYYITSLKEGWYDTCGWNHFIGVLQLGGQNDNP